MEKKVFNLMIIVIAIILYNRYFIPNTHVFAQEKTVLTVYPAIQDIKVNVGDNKDISIKFRNGSDNVISGGVRVADFIVVDKKGSIELISDTSIKPQYSAAAWITLSDSVITIPPNETVAVKLNINVPNSIESCGHYAAVYFQPNNQDKTVNQSASKIDSKIGGLINLIVKSNKCNESLNISLFNVLFFSEYGPVKVSFNLLNVGNIHVRPNNQIALLDIFGHEVGIQNISGLRIFPEKAKQYEANLGKKWMFGRYKIKLLSSYGNFNQKVVSKEAYIWVLPWKLILLIVLTIIVVIYLTHNLYKDIFKKDSKSINIVGLDRLRKNVHKRD